MSLRTLKTTALAAVATLALAACGSGGGSADDTAGAAQPGENEIVIGSTNEPTSLQRFVGGSSGVSQTMTRNVYEPLVAIDVDGEIVPALAETWDISEDGLTYTFHLREGVTFHDGTPFTSADAVWALTEIISDESVAARKSDLAVMDQITAVDEQTVEVVLSAPTRSLLFYLAGVTIVKDGDTEHTTENGTGPYELVEWAQGDYLTIAPYEEYWGDAPANDGVTFRFFTDTTALNNALLTGDLDLVIAEDSPDQLAQFEGNDAFTISEGSSTTKQIWAFNDRVAPFDDVRVRQGLYRAIDRESILEAVWAGRGEVVGSMVPPTDPWFVDVADTHAYDPESARQLLGEAGVEDLTITLDYVAGDTEETIAQLLQSDLADVGVTLELNPIDDATWYERIYTNHDFETTLMGHVNPRDMLWYANPDFYWGYDSAEVQQLVADSERAGSEEEQAELLSQANVLMAEEAASAWLYLEPQIRVAAAGVTGFPVDQVTESFYVADITRES